MKMNYLQDRETGELITYTEARRRFYSTPRAWYESIFDEYDETSITSPERLEAPAFGENLLNL